MTNLLEAEFSEEGSNNRRFENVVYAKFMKSLREAANHSFLYNLQVEGELQYLSHILQFKTGAEEEPVLRFVLHLRLQFVEVTTTFISTANTCINCLNLPHQFRDIFLLPENKLFNLYDLVLSNACFGHV
ncbi:unnamed protein product [Pocillopora meandrina]|uniref:Uncharacterized protein n=1 Tax=Pocillopora meandrina TaxID=46732 RepID=A0AAU9XIK8_9CNID|nr:unnamed protein product [Pocillopora meandrina]